MVVMDEAAVVAMVVGLWAMAAYIFYLKLFVVRRLRGRIDRHTEEVLATARAAAIAPADAGTQDRGEMKRLQQRLEVLERIAVEKEDSLAREIEDLRIASR